MLKTIRSSMKHPCSFGNVRFFLNVIVPAAISYSSHSSDSSTRYQLCGCNAFSSYTHHTPSTNGQYIYVNTLMPVYTVLHTVSLNLCTTGTTGRSLFYTKASNPNITDLVLVIIWYTRRIQDLSPQPLESTIVTETF